MERIVLLGPPASGKGTQGRRLSTELGLPVVSTGQMLRSEEVNGSEIGKLSLELSKTGTLVPDGAVLEMVAHWMAENGPRFIFDGFPRTVPQGEAFSQFLEGIDRPLDHVLYFELPGHRAKERIVGRLTCVHCGRAFSPAQISTPADGRHPGTTDCPECGEPLVRRRDDAGEVFDMRMEQYRTKTTRLVEYYHGQGLLRAIDADAGPAEVSRRVDRVLAAAGSGAER